MSAGVFSLVGYTANYDADQIHPIRVQPETIAAAIAGTTNAAPAGAVTNPISAVISLNRGSLGLRPRYVVLQAPLTGQPDGYAPGGITRIPALQEAFWTAAIKGVTCTYLGVAFTVISREPERAR